MAHDQHPQESDGTTDNPVFESLLREYDGLPTRDFGPHETPLLPWKRFYLAPGGSAALSKNEWDEGEDYVDAPSVVAAALYAQRLYGKGWGRFSRCEWRETEHGESVVFALTEAEAVRILAALPGRGRGEEAGNRAAR